MMRNRKYKTTNQIENEILANARQKDQKVEEQRQKAKPRIDWPNLTREELHRELRKIGV